MVTVADDLATRTHAGFLHAMATMASRCGGVAHGGGSRLLYASPLADPVPWSGAIRVGPELADEAFVAEAAVWRASLGHAITLWTRPERDETLEAWLRADGWEPPVTLARMVLERPDPALWPAARPGVRTAAVADTATLRDLRAACGAAFADRGVPPTGWATTYGDLDTVMGDDVVGFVALLGDRAGAAGVGYLRMGAGTLLHAGTDPAFRGHGLAEAVVVALGAELVRRGADLLTLDTGPAGAALCRRLGYREIGRLRRWRSL